MNIIEYKYNGLKHIIFVRRRSVDQAALQAAKDVGISTDDWVPKRWKTCVGPQKHFPKSFNPQEYLSGYKERT